MVKCTWVFSVFILNRNLSLSTLFSPFSLPLGVSVLAESTPLDFCDLKQNQNGVGGIGQEMGEVRSNKRKN